MPEPVDGDDVDALVDAVGLATGVEEVSGTELFAESVAQGVQTRECFTVDFSAGLDLEPYDRTVEGLGDEVDLLAVVGTPVADLTDVVLS